MYASHSCDPLLSLGSHTTSLLLVLHIIQVHCDDVASQPYTMGNLTTLLLSCYAGTATTSPFHPDLRFHPLGYDPLLSQLKDEQDAAKKLAEQKA